MKLTQLQFYDNWKNKIWSALLHLNNANAFFHYLQKLSYLKENFYFDINDKPSSRDFEIW